jgi:hypothetical protein
MTKRKESGGEDQRVRGEPAQPFCVPPPDAKLNAADGEDHIDHVTHDEFVPSSAATESDRGEDQTSFGDSALARGVPPLSDTIEAIKAAHRRRCYWMQHRKRSDLSLGAYLRDTLGWSLSLPADERDRIKDKAAELIKAGETYVKACRKAEAKATKTGNLEMPPMPADPNMSTIIPTIEMRRRIDELEAEQTKEMERLVRTLPVWAWAKDIRGIEACGVAIIVAEVGRDLSDFPTKGKLYKRLGVACMDNRRQGAVPKGLTPEARKQAWIDEKYSPVRRSRIWTIGTSLLMSGNERYRQIYLDRKAYEIASAEAAGLIVAPANKIPKKRAGEYRSVGHIHNRARRYMEKKFLSALWKAWRAITGTVSNQTNVDLSPATLLGAADD